MAENKNAQQVREITEKLEQGIKELFESKRFKEYLRTMSKFYNYSFNNTLLIAMQKPEATYVAGYTSWMKNFDRHVKKDEKSIKILAPAPYKTKAEQEKIDPTTNKPILNADGKPVVETVEIMRPAFKVVSVFDVSQTDGKELPDIMVGQLSGSVEQYEAFWRALKEISPVPVALEKIEGGAHGYYHLMDKRIAIDEGMSEMQTIKTLIHEIAHAKLHAIAPSEPEPEPKWKVVMVSEGGTKRDLQTAFESEAEAIATAEKADWIYVDENQFEWRLEVEEDIAPIQAQMKDRHTKEVEAESVAYTVCQRYGLETSDYSFGYIAGWSSNRETKELKGSLETIRKTAAEMIEGIDAQLKVLLTEKEQPAVQVEDAPPAPLRDDGIPLYRETANYAYEAGELDAYRASHKANLDCREAIEQAIAENYGDNQLSSESAVKSVLEQFSSQRVEYVLANTIQHKDWDGRISRKNIDWAASIEVCPENSTQFIVDKAHPGLTDLFVKEFVCQVEAIKQEQPTREASQGPEVAEAPIVKAPEVSGKAQHRLTKDEKEIKAAVMDALKSQIAHNNEGIFSPYRTSPQSTQVMMRHRIRIEGNTITQNGEPLFAVHRRHAAKKTQGCYRELIPTLEYIRRDKTLEAKQEKPSIRDQLRALEKQSAERRTPTKAKKHEMGLE